MTLKERIENNLTLFVLGMLLAGFVGGVTAYRALLEIAKPEVVQRGAPGPSQSSPGVEPSPRAKGEPEPPRQTADRVRELEHLVSQERSRADRSDKALQTMESQTTERMRELEGLIRQERTRADNAEKALQATRGGAEQLKKGVAAKGALTGTPQAALPSQPAAVPSAAPVVGQREQQDVASPSSPASDKGPRQFRDRPYPAEIVNELKQRPPFQREEAARHYRGLHVSWEVVLEFVTAISVDRVRLMLLDRGSYPWVTCELAVNQHPEVKTMKKGTKLRINGTIDEAKGDENEIVVTNAVLSAR